jgi:hypothetical protein
MPEPILRMSSIVALCDTSRGNTQCGPVPCPHTPPACASPGLFASRPGCRSFLLARNRAAQLADAILSLRGASERVRSAG